METENVDHIVWHHKNRGNYELSIVARLRGPSVSNVKYILRLTDPKGYTIDYITTLDGFKEMGELFSALHNFCKLPMYVDQKDIHKLKELLTPGNIKKFAEIIKSSKLG